MIASFIVGTFCACIMMIIICVNNQDNKQSYIINMLETLLVWMIITTTIQSYCLSNLQKTVDRIESTQRIK